MNAFLRPMILSISMLGLALGVLACTPPDTPVGGEATREAAVRSVAKDGTTATDDQAVSEADPSSDASTDLASSPAEDGALLPVTMMLDWVPNTNHTGIFVAQSEGYFEAAGLDVQIVQPGEVYAEQAVAAGAADFGISYQEALTLARADDIPLVSVAAIIQHNSSGFASRAELEVEDAAGYAGLRYGTFGTPFELPTLEALMACAGATPERIETVQSVNLGYSDPLALLAAGQIDLAWIFQGWQGVQAEREGIALDTVWLEDQLECIPDYYTPILVASEATLSERPELAAAFVGAVARGYDFAIERPLDAAEILLEAAPELELGLVLDSQTWLSPRYQADAPRWGEQRAEVWQAYGDWMARQGIIPAPIDAEAAFSNAFLP